MEQAAVEQLVMMGFPVNASRRALFNSANNVEMAMDWLCTHIDRVVACYLGNGAYLS